MGRKSPLEIEVSAEERVELERRAHGFAIPHRTVMRARVVLKRADGRTLSEIAKTIGMQRRIVRKWLERFIKKRLAGLEDDPRSGRPARFSPRSRDRAGEAGLRAAGGERPVAVALDLR
jgi:predicted ArsR family transcriptional regulator